MPDVEQLAFTVQHQLHRVRQPLRGLLVVALASSAIVLNARQATSVSGLLDRAGQYVKQFERDLSVVIADESYQQLVTSAASSRALTSRHTKAEFAFIEVPPEVQC